MPTITIFPWPQAMSEAQPQASEAIVVIVQSSFGGHKAHPTVLVGVHLTQIQRYESGTTQPTLEVIRKLALALAVSGDALIFDPEERGPDDELKLQFEAVRQLPPEDRQAIKAMLDGMIVKHRTKQLVGELRT